MRLKLFSALTLVLSFSLVARSADVKDADAIQGTWLPVAAELAGAKFPDKARQSITLEIKDDNYTVSIAAKLDKGTLKLDPSAKPKRMVITGTEGPSKGKKILAIYELDGDRLKICYDLSGKAYPTEFKSKADTQLFLVTYNREKP